MSTENINTINILRTSTSTIAQIFAATNGTIVIFDESIELNGSSYTVNGNCKWIFEGGQISEGKLSFLNKVEIESNYQIFFGTSLSDSSGIMSDILKPEWFGAKGDGQTDDTLAIKNMISFIRVKKTESPVPSIERHLKKTTLKFESSLGYVISDTITINKHCHIDASTFIWKGGNKTALYFDAITYCDLKFDIVSVSDNSGWYQIDWSKSDKTGVVFKNLLGCRIDINKCNGFTKGIVCWASDGKGFCDNRIYLGEIYTSLYGFTVKSTNGGWPNKNWVYGGRFGANTGSYKVDGVTQNRCFIKVESDGLYGTNSWVFKDQSFDGRVMVDNVEKLRTLILDCSDSPVKGVREWLITDSRVEGVTSIQPNVINPPVFILGSETQNFKFITNQYCDNQLAIMCNGDAPTNLQYMNITTEKDYVELYSLNNVLIEREKIELRGSAYLYKVPFLSFYGIYGKYAPYRYNFGYDKGMLLEIKPNCKFDFKGRKRVYVYLLDENFNHIHKDDAGDVRVPEGNTGFYYRADAGYVPFYMNHYDSPVHSGSIVCGENINAKYIFIASTGEELKIYGEYGNVLPQIAYFYEPQHQVKDHYFIDKPLENLNLTVQAGTKFYDLSLDKVYTIEKSGTFGSLVECRFAGNQDDTVLRLTQGDVNMPILRVGQYCHIGGGEYSTKFRIEKINIAEGYIEIDTPLVYTMNNVQIQFDPAIYS